MKKSKIEGRAEIIRDYISFLLLFSSSSRALARTHRDSLAIHAKIHDVADDSESTRMCKRNSKEFTRDAFFVHSLCTLFCMSHHDDWLNDDAKKNNADNIRIIVRGKFPSLCDFISVGWMLLTFSQWMNFPSLAIVERSVNTMIPIVCVYACVSTMELSC